MIVDKRLRRGSQCLLYECVEISFWAEPNASKPTELDIDKWSAAKPIGPLESIPKPLGA